MPIMTSDKQPRKGGRYHKTHGESKTRIYKIWRHMKNRCALPNSAFYKYYGGRGIIVCNEWENDFVTFRNWAMSNGYSSNLTIDRTDNDGNYEPSNCRWITQSEQTKNQRHKLAKTGLKYIHKDPRCNSYFVQMWGKNRGNFPTIEEAYAMREYVKENLKFETPTILNS